MAWIVADSWDYYATVADIPRSVWDGATSMVLSSNTRFGIGSSITSAVAATTLTKNMASNESILFVAFAYYHPGAISGTGAEFAITFQDAGTAQCTIVMESSGSVVLKRGGNAGTVVATYAGAFTQDVWNHFQIKIVISDTAGSLTVRKNGALTDTFTASGLNTRSTANNYANGFLFNRAASGAQSQIDDFLCFSGAGAAPNTWVGDVRAICLPPAADTATKIFSATPVTTMTASYATVSTNTNVANVLTICSSFTPTRSGAVTKVSITLTALMTGHLQAALYADDGGTGLPGTLLFTSAVVTNPAAGVVDLVFTGASIVSNRTYYVAFLADASFATSRESGGGGGYQRAQAYASGFPNPAGTVTTLSIRPGSWVVTFVGNVISVSELVSNGDTDYVFSSTPGDTDLYEVADLTLSLGSIVGVVTKMYCKKSDAGARSGQLQVVSGATTVTGVDTLLASTYTYLSRVDAVDPATGTTWTLAGLNALKIGVKVTA